MTWFASPAWVTPQLLPGGRVHCLGSETQTQSPAPASRKPAQASRKPAQAGRLRPGHAQRLGSGAGKGASQRSSCRGCLAVVNRRPLSSQVGRELQRVRAVGTPRPSIDPSTNEGAVRPTRLLRKSYKLWWAGLCFPVPPIPSPLPLPGHTNGGTAGGGGQGASGEPETE